MGPFWSQMCLFPNDVMVPDPSPITYGHFLVNILLPPSLWSLFGQYPPPPHHFLVTFWLRPLINVWPTLIVPKVTSFMGSLLSLFLFMLFWQKKSVSGKIRASRSCDPVHRAVDARVWPRHGSFQAQKEANPRVLSERPQENVWHPRMSKYCIGTPTPLLNKRREFSTFLKRAH